MTVLVAGAQIGKYKLGRKLGQGGFGVVFLAHDTSLDREVALKFLNPEHTATTQMLQRFLQEARSAAKIMHPGIVTVFECGQITGTNSAADGAAYIAMERLVGESLTDRLARSGRLAPDSAMEIARQLASALEAAHRAGIVHRDLKPDNIFLVQDPAVPNGERVKILDFGIAKLGRTASSSVQTQSMMVFGTPRYMSPEQCKSAAHVDYRSDIYTLGCILFELVAGQPPFAGEPGELIAQHLLIPAPPLVDFAPGIPPQLDELVTTMLAKKPEDRPGTMAAVQRGLESVGAMSPGVAPTLAPDAIEAILPRVSAGYRVPSAPPITPRASLGLEYPAAAQPAITANPTTLSAATSSSVVKRQSMASSKMPIFIGSGVAAVAILIAVIVVVRSGSNDQPARPPETPAKVADVKREPSRPESLAAESSQAESSHAKNTAAPVAPDVTKPDATRVGATKVDTAKGDATPPAKPVKPPVRAVEPRKVAPATQVAAAPGVLSVSATPPCEVIIDGAPFHTPIRSFKIAAGKHKVVLVNADLGVNETITVEIKPGGSESVDRDYSDRVRKAEPPTPPSPPVDPHKDEAGKGSGGTRDRTINPFTKKP